MKKRDYICTTTLENGKTLKPVIRKTEKGISDYANKMFSKYGEKIKVSVDYMTEFGMLNYTTYEA